MEKLIDANNLKEELESLKVTITGIELGKEIKKNLEEYKKSVLKVVDDQEEINPWVTDRFPTAQEREKNYDSYMGDSQFIVTIEGAEQTTTLWLEEDNTWIDDSGNCYKVEAWKCLPDAYEENEGEKYE